VVSIYEAPWLVRGSEAGLPLWGEQDHNRSYGFVTPSTIQARNIDKPNCHLIRCFVETPRRLK